MTKARIARWGAVVALLALVGAGSYWAGAQTFGAPVTEPQDVSHVVYDVAEASIGRTLNLNVTVDQPFRPVATNALTGTVTRVEVTDFVDVGEPLYEVDTMPVHAVVGDVPFWRSMASGSDGDDVAQLQSALAELGFYHGEVDGRFRWSTTEAVSAWQRSRGLRETGTVQLGELVAVPILPTPLQLSDDVYIGARLSGGEQVVAAPSGKISFNLVVSANQANLIPADADVLIHHEGHTWSAILGESRTDEGGNIRFDLSARDGGLVCGDECDLLPAAERTSLRAEVTVVSPVSGPAVPVAAVHTDVDGTTWVRLANGERREVTVQGSSGGVAVLDGLDEGERVRVLDAAANGSPPVTSQPPSASQVKDGNGAGD